MLEKAIEIEGLLRIIRDGQPMPETYTLLTKKTAELSELSAGLDKKDISHKMEDSQIDFVMAQPSASTVQPEVVFADEELTEKDETLLKIEEETDKEEKTDTVTEDLALDEEDDIILTFEDSHDEDTIETASAIKISEHPDHQPEDTMSEYPEMEASKQDESSSSTEVTIEADVPETTTESISQDSGSEEDGATEKTNFEVQAAAQPKRHVKLKSAFSLNDRFLYSRELFGGNMKTFDSTIELIEGIGDFTGIENYFYNDLKWNREDSRVNDFMEIVRAWSM